MEYKLLADYYELIEGSAYYVESKVFLELEGEVAYNDKYGMESFSYTNGTSKYYENGRLKFLLLDKVTPGWQSDFDCSTSVMALLADMLG